MFERVRQARGDEAPLVRSLKIAIATRYRTLKSAQTDLPGFTKPRWSKASWKITPGASPSSCRKDPDNTDLQSQLHDAVATLVKKVLDTQAERINKMRDALDAEQKQYDENSKNVEEVVDRKVNRMTAESVAFNHAVDRAQSSTTDSPAADSPTTMPTTNPGDDSGG